MKVPTAALPAPAAPAPAAPSPQAQAPQGQGPLVDRIIMGVDPGTINTGYGLLHLTGGGLRLLAWGVVQLGRTELDHPKKLHRVFHRILALIDEHKPDELAVEAPFYGANVQSMLKLGRAQGVVMAAAMLRSLPIAEYAPTRIKQSVTGRGRASKEQVAAMLAHTLPELRTHADQPTLHDASDALSVALCHYYQTSREAAGRPVPRSAPGSGRKKQDPWAAFAAQNPARVG